MYSPVGWRSAMCPTGLKWSASRLTFLYGEGLDPWILPSPALEGHLYFLCMVSLSTFKAEGCVSRTLCGHASSDSLLPLLPSMDPHNDLETMTASRAFPFGDHVIINFNTLIPIARHSSESLVLSVEHRHHRMPSHCLPTLEEKSQHDRA